MQAAHQPTKYTYTGQYSYTADFGLMYYNARWVDVSLGRFAQADAIVPDLYDSQNHDRYSYVRNNPINRIDPSGHIDFSCLMDGCPDADSTAAAIALGGLFNLGVLGNLQAAMEIVVANEYGDLIYKDDSERWPQDAAITRRYNEYCSVSVWSQRCVQSFWGYVEIIRNSGKNSANVAKAKTKVDWYNANKNVTNLALAILNPGVEYGGYETETKWQSGCFDENGNSIGLCHWGTYSDPTYIEALRNRVNFDANGNGSNVAPNWRDPLIVDYATYIIDLGDGFWQVITNEWQWQEDCAKYGCYGDGS